MELILTLLILLSISFLFTTLARLMKIPSVIALILSGLLLGFPIFKQIIIFPNSEIIFGLGDAALVALMFLAGLESSWQVIYHERKDALYIALFASLIPFLLGFGAFLYFGFSIIISFVVGLCMAITAEATKAKVLLELRKLKSKVGSTMIGAGIIDDVLGLLIFAIITFIFGSTEYKEQVLIVLAIISFFIGLLVQGFAREHHITKKIEFSLNYFIIPFFFIAMGLHFELSSLIVSPLILFSIVIIAMIGKLWGTLLAKPFVDFNWKQLYLIGWGMNSRGAVELAMAMIAFRSSIIDESLYSALVIMALVTTLMFPFVITKMVHKNKHIMN